MIKIFAFASRKDGGVLALQGTPDGVFCLEKPRMRDFFGRYVCMKALADGGI